MPGNSFDEEVFPNIQIRLPLEQLGAISFCTVSCYTGEETEMDLL